MLTKTQIAVMQIFTSKITERFSILEISKLLKKPYALIHRSIKPLIEKNFLIKDRKELLSLNYKENISEISYIESIRKQNFLSKDKTLALFTKDTITQKDLNFFILLIFGSSIEKDNPKDIDILLILENEEKIEEIEKILKNVSSNFNKKFDINVISVKSVKEMLSKREEPNLINETLNKHILLFGAENYYNILKNAR